MNKNSFFYGLGTGIILTATIFYITLAVVPTTENKISIEGNEENSNLETNENLEKNIEPSEVQTTGENTSDNTVPITENNVDQNTDSNNNDLNSTEIKQEDNK